MSRSKMIIPLSILIVTALLLAVSTIFLEKKPVIESITPELGRPGDILIITGRHFGKGRNGSEVNLAGIRPVTDSYRLWSDNRIEIYLPEKLQSGMISLMTDAGLSNGILFTNRDHIPVILDGPNQGIPYIESIDPPEGSTGTEITIKGVNFGLERASNLVFFTPENSIQDRSSGSVQEVMIPATDRDFDYISWTDNEIKLFVPDGAVSGNVKIFNEKGLSDGFYFEVKGQVGNRVFTSQKTYEFTYGVSISDVEAVQPNSLDIWLPRPAETIFQKTLMMNYSTAPLWENYRNNMRFRLEDIKSWRTYDIQITSSIIRYAYETRIDPDDVPSRYSKKRTLYKQYTIADNYIPADNSDIKELGKKFVRTVRYNPYKGAKKIYEYILKNMEYLPDDHNRSVSKALAEKKGNSYTYNAIFCGVCRRAGMPARLISGIYAIPGEPLKQHYWSEFYIEKFGWIPVDPVMGDRYIKDKRLDIEDRKEFYFGNMDDYHIILSRGMAEIEKLNPQGKAYFDPDSYAMQTIHCELYGEIQRYKLNCNDFFVNAVW